MKALRVPPNEIPSVWNEIKPILGKALRGEEDIIADDLLEPLENGRAFLWIVVDGDDIESVCLGEMVEYPRKKSFYILAWATKSGYKYDEVMETFNDSVVNFAKINGCDFIEAKVRKGLAKKLKWNDKHSLVTLTL